MQNPPSFPAFSQRIDVIGRIITIGFALLLHRAKIVLIVYT